jgi:hypothetical protein
MEQLFGGIGVLVYIFLPVVLNTEPVSTQSVFQMWEIQTEFSLLWRKDYYKITKDGRLIAFFLDKEEAQEYYERKKDGQVQDSGGGRT